MDWQSPKVELPTQGKKILCLKGGDVYVAQRFGDRYFTYIRNAAEMLEHPTLWAYFEMPEPYEGLFKVSLGDGEFMTIDEFEQKHPDEYKEFISSICALKWATGRDDLKLDEDKTREVDE